MCEGDSLTSIRENTGGEGGLLTGVRGTGVCHFFTIFPSSLVLVGTIFGNIISPC